MGGVTVAIGAHIGGFVAGLVMARPLLGWRFRRA
jgi:membrane associated rhomboid family serine protease